MTAIKKKKKDEEERKKELKGFPVAFYPLVCVPLMVCPAVGYCCNSITRSMLHFACLPAYITGQGKGVWFLIQISKCSQTVTFYWASLANSQTLVTTVTSILLFLACFSRAMKAGFNPPPPHPPTFCSVDCISEKYVVCYFIHTACGCPGTAVVY